MSVPWVHPEAVFLPRSRFSWKWGYLDLHILISRGERKEPLNLQHPRAEAVSWTNLPELFPPSTPGDPGFAIIKTILTRPDCSVAAIWETKAVCWEVLPVLQNFVTSTQDGHVQVPVLWGQTGTSPPRAAELQNGHTREHQLHSASRHQLKQMKNKICTKYLYLYTIYYIFIIYIVAILDIDN